MATIWTNNDKTIVNGVPYKVPKWIFGNTVVQDNNHLYINGRELKKGKWKFTFMSIIKSLFL